MIKDSLNIKYNHRYRNINDLGEKIWKYIENGEYIFDKY